MRNFSKADSSVYSTFLELLERTFPELTNFSFGLLFRNKIKKSKGRVTLAEICLPSKLMSYYAKNKEGNPYDYILVVDEMVWSCATDKDRIRIMRHELRHVFVDEKGNPKLIDHDFADFHVEVDLNKNDPMWASKLIEVAQAGYKQVKDGQKDPRVDRKNSEGLAPVGKPKPRQVQIEAANNSSKKDPEKKTDIVIRKKPCNKELKTDAQQLRDEVDAGVRGSGQAVSGGEMQEDFIPNETVNNTGKSLRDMAKERGLVTA